MTMMLLLLACAEPTTDQFDVGGEILTVSVEVDLGNVTVMGENRQNVHIERQVTGFLEGGPSLKNGTLRVPVACSGILGCSGEVTVRVPYDVPVTVRVHEGDIRISDLESALVLETGHGDVIATGLRSPTLRAYLGLGSVQASFLDTPQAITIGTGVGDIALSLPGGNYALDTNAQGGTEISPAIQATTDPAPRVEVRTTTGKVTILAGNDTGS